MTTTYLGYTTIPTGADLEARLGFITPEMYGAKADGVTDDSAAFLTAEAARVAAGLTELKGTPGKVYRIAPASVTGLPKMLAAGTWNFRGATIKYDGANLTTDGTYPYPVLSLLASDTLFIGTIDLNAKARYGIGFKHTVNGARIDAKIKNPLAPASLGVWSCLVWSVSKDITGDVADPGSARAKMTSGILVRPDAPTMNADVGYTLTGSTIGATAVLIGSDQNFGNGSGWALVSAGNINNAIIAPWIKAIMLSPRASEANDTYGDFVAHDIGCNAIENYGHPNAGGDYGTTGTVASALPDGIMVKNGAFQGFYRLGYTPISTSIERPTILMTGGAGASAADERGHIEVGGRILTRPVVLVPSAGAVTPNAITGEVFRIASGVNLTVNSPTNPQDGQRLVLDIANSSGGAITVTLGATFLGTFPAPASTKRRTQVYSYDSTAAKWVPLGAQSGDL